MNILKMASYYIVCESHKKENKVQVSCKFDEFV